LSKDIRLAYGTRRFIIVFTKARHWTLFWAKFHICSNNYEQYCECCTEGREDTGFPEGSYRNFHVAAWLQNCDVFWRRVVWIQTLMRLDKTMFCVW
jgi:hypothetical protein